MKEFCLLKNLNGEFRTLTLVEIISRNDTEIKYVTTDLKSSSPNHYSIHINDEEIIQAESWESAIKISKKRVIKKFENNINSICIGEKEIVAITYRSDYQFNIYYTTKDGKLSIAIPILKATGRRESISISLLNLFKKKYKDFLYSKGIFLNKNLISQLQISALVYSTIYVSYKTNVFYINRTNEILSLLIKNPKNLKYLKKEYDSRKRKFEKESKLFEKIKNIYENLTEEQKLFIEVSGNNN